MPLHPPAITDTHELGTLIFMVVSFAYIRNRSARTSSDSHPRSRTLLTYAGPSRADLESVLGR